VTVSSRDVKLKLLRGPQKQQKLPMGFQNNTSSVPKKKRIDFDQLLLENNKIFWILVKIHILDHFKHFNCFFIKIFIIVGTFEEN
jgi:hypothetical protein